MGGRTRTVAAIAATTAAVLGSGCGGGGPTAEERSEDALGAFVKAVDAKDGAAVCAALTPNAVRSVEKLARTQKRPKAGCEDLVRGQLAGFLTPDGDALEVTGNREVSAGRRELVSPTLNGLTTNPFTLVQEEGGDDFKVALFAGDDLGDRLKRSAACSRYRQTALRLPLPPATVGRYPRYLRRVARQVARRDRDLRTAFGSGLEAQAVDGIAASLRSAARDIAAGRNAKKAAERADARLQQFDALVTYVERSANSGDEHDCGPDPHQSERARAYRKRLKRPCRTVIRRLKREEKLLDGAASRETVIASLERVLKEIKRADDAFAEGALPDVLDVVRDGTVKDARRLEAIVRDQIAAIKAFDLAGFNAAVARYDDLAGAADVGTARLRLRACLVPRETAALPKSTSRA